MLFHRIWCFHITVYCILCNFCGFNAYIILTYIIVPFIDVFSYECYEWEREREREKERESEYGEIERKQSFGLSTVPAFVVTLKFLTPTLPRYKTEAKKLEEKTEEAACSETAIKFSIDSSCPKFLLKYAPLISCDVEGYFLCSRMCSQINTRV